MLATYAAKYRSLKAPRKLQWKPNLGTVQLELAIGDQTLEFNVSAGGEGVGVCVRGGSGHYGDRRANGCESAGERPHLPMGHLHWPGLGGGHTGHCCARPIQGICGRCAAVAFAAPGQQQTHLDCPRILRPALQVSPFHASVLMHFHTRPEWPATELAEKMGVAPDALRRKIIFWINQGEAGAGQGFRRGHGLLSGLLG